MKRNELISYISKKIIDIKLKKHDRCMIIGIEGQGCSGKSILSQEIKNFLIKAGYKSEIVSIDDFCNKRDVRYSGYSESYEQHYYNNFDYKKFQNDVLEQAQKNGKLEFNDYVLDIAKDQYTKRLDISLENEGILIVEGIFIFKDEFKKYFDYSIILTIDGSEQLKRASQRDLLKSGNLEAVLNKYTGRYLPAYALYEKINQPYEFVDLVIDNTNIEIPYIVKENKGNIK